MATSVNGLVTGLETDKIITGILSVNQKRISLLQSNQAKVGQEQAAFKGIQARLLTLQGKITQLARSQNGAFDVKNVASSNKDLVTAAATASAAPGVYTLRVNSLARAHQVATQGFDSADSAITQGTVQVRVGSGATTTVTIDSTNNTFQGLADAINNSGAAVTATLVNDGSDPRTQPFRLVLTAKDGGADNVITVTNNLGADAGGAAKPVLDATYIGAAVTSTAYTGTATPTANTGAGGYTGTTNNTFRFTVLHSGSVGTDDGLQIGYVDNTGTVSGTVTLDSGDAGVFKSVANGVQVQFNAGTLVAGQTFAVDAFVPTLQQAASAAVTLGSGSGALTIESNTNQIDGVISGVTLNLLAPNTLQDVTLTVSSDTQKARQAVVDFIESYNDVLEFIDDQSRYDAQTGQAGLLLGNRSATTIQEQVRRALSDVVSGVNPQLNRLSALGITTNSEGRLDVNQARLDDVFAGRVAGVSLTDVRRLFAFSGQSTNPGVQFVTGGVRTKAATEPYQVDLLQAARQASITATNTLAASTIIDGTNNNFSLTLDGKTSGVITLADGTYTRLQLAQELAGKINAHSELAGRKVTASLTGDRLAVTSSSYGLVSEVTIGAGSALAALGFAGTETNRGQDVAGSFVVNGVNEAAVGTGQFLVGNSTNANTADLQVRVTLSSTQIQPGSEAALIITRGIASRLDLVLTNLLDPVSGRIKTVDEGLQTNVDDLQKAIDRQNQLLETRRQSLVLQFAALEGIVSQLRSTGDFLSTQLTSITALKQK